jgi:hypothetical protein
MITPNIPLTLEMKLTLFTFNALAMTVRHEITIKQLLETPTRTYDGWRLGVMRPRGKRKDYYLDIRDGSVVLPGWDIKEILTDMEASQLPERSLASGISCAFSGNACLNFVGDRDKIKALAESSIFTLHDEVKATILVHPYPGGDPDNFTLLYPDLETPHAVINRIKERINQSTLTA